SLRPSKHESTEEARYCGGARTHGLTGRAGPTHRDRHPPYAYDPGSRPPAAAERERGRAPSLGLRSGWRSCAVGDAEAVCVELRRRRDDDAVLDELDLVHGLLVAGRVERREGDVRGVVAERQDRAGSGVRRRFDDPLRGRGGPVVALDRRVRLAGRVVDDLDLPETPDGG